MKKYLTEIIICLLIIASGVGIYSQLGGYSYILYDDMSSIYDPFLIKGISLKKIGDAFYTPPSQLPYQVPIPTIVRLTLWEFFGDDLGKHHFFSLSLHIIIALMVFLFLRSETGRIFASGFCAILFTVHPINVEAVSWLAGFNGMLEAFFLIITLICYSYYVKRSSLRRYLLVFPPFMLGLMCKPTMAILPFLLFLLDYWPFQRFTLKPTGIKNKAFEFSRIRIVLEKLPLMALAPIQLAAGRLMISGQLRGNGPASWSFYPGSIVDFVLYLKKIFYPIGLTICRPDPPEASLWTMIGLGVVLLLISLVLLWKANSRGYLVTGWFWFLIASAPIMVMVFLSGRAVEDHHLYIPVIGIFVMISFGLSSFLPGFKKGRFFFIITGAIVTILLLPIAYLQVRHWENSITIFNHALSVYPDNKKAHVNLGDAYLGKNDINKAMQHYRRFLSLSPDSAIGHTKLATALALADMSEEAELHYGKALRLAPAYVPAHHGLADLLARLGKTDQAIVLYRKALQINPDLFQTHNNLAIALYEQGFFQKALDHLNESVKINPTYQTAVRNRKIIIDAMKNSKKLDGLAEKPGVTADPANNGFEARE